MKKNKKKIFIIITLLVLSFGLIFVSNTSYAANDMWFEEAVEEVGSFAIHGLVTILTLALKYVALAFFSVVKMVLSAVVNFGMETDNFIEVTPAVFIFNQVPVTTIDFFSTLNSTGYVGTLSSSIAQWFYIIRNISIIILLGILIYVGIRMAISTLAEDKAKYKKMLIDWIVSLVLVFLLQYIMIIVIEINNALVDLLAKAFIGNTGGESASLTNLAVYSGNLTDVMDYLWAESWSLSFLQGFGCTVLYGMLVIITLIFMIMYMKRMIIAAFLTMISPLITITYSMDKMGDGRSQALNTWLKEYCYNILIQPFHCIIYGTLVNTAVTAMGTEDTKSLAMTIMSIMTLFFIFTAEDLVKKIFGVQPSSLEGAIATGALAMTAISKIAPKKKNKKQSAGRIDGSTGAQAGSNGGNSTIFNSSNQNSSGGNSQTTTGTPTNSTSQTRTSSTPQTPQAPQRSGATQSPQQQEPQTQTTEKGRFNVGNVVKAIGKGAGNLGKGIVKANTTIAKKAAGGVIGGIVGFATGNEKAAAAGVGIGLSVSDSIETKINNKKYDKDTKYNENAVGIELREWAGANGINNSEALVDNVSNIMDADVEDLDPDQRAFRAKLDALAKHYRGAGEDKNEARDHVMETVADYSYGNRTINAETDYASTGYYETRNARNLQETQQNEDAEKIKIRNQIEQKEIERHKNAESYYNQAREKKGYQEDFIDSNGKTWSKDMV